jgi:transcriptional regulator with XRE-family HTH domain
LEGKKEKFEIIFGRALQKLRRKKILSQEDLAHKSGLDRTYISSLERDVYQPTISTIFALSKALNMTPSELIKEVEKEEANKAYLESDTGGE